MASFKAPERAVWERCAETGIQGASAIGRIMATSTGHTALIMRTRSLPKPESHGSEGRAHTYAHCSTSRDGRKEGASQMRPEEGVQRTWVSAGTAALSSPEVGKVGACLLNKQFQFFKVKVDLEIGSPNKVNT